MFAKMGHIGAQHAGEDSPTALWPRTRRWAFCAPPWSASTRSTCARSPRGTRPGTRARGTTARRRRDGGVVLREERGDRAVRRGRRRERVRRGRRAVLRAQERERRRGLLRLLGAAAAVKMRQQVRVAMVPCRPVTVPNGACALVARPPGGIGASARENGRRGGPVAALDRGGTVQRRIAERSPFHDAERRWGCDGPLRRRQWLHFTGAEGRQVER